MSVASGCLDARGTCGEHFRRRVQSPCFQIGDCVGESMFVGLVARAEIELRCAFGDRLEQDLSQKYFARRMSRQPDVKAGNAPKIAPLVTQPKVVRNRLP